MRKSRAAVVGILAVGAVLLSSCHAQRADQDVVSFTDGNGDIFTQEIDEYPSGALPAAEGISNIYYDIDANCGPSGNDAHGSWGTVDSDRTDNTNTSDDVRANTTPPDSTMVNCALATWQDDPEDDDDGFSMVCDDAGTDNDCQDPDASSNYVVNQDATDFYNASVDTYSEMQELLGNVRDFMAGTIVDDDGPSGPTPSSPGAPGCIQLRIDGLGQYPLNGTTTSMLHRVCYR